MLMTKSETMHKKSKSSQHSRHTEIEDDASCLVSTSFYSFDKRRMYTYIFSWNGRKTQILGCLFACQTHLSPHKIFRIKPDIGNVNSRLLGHVSVYSNSDFSFSFSWTSQYKSQPFSAKRTEEIVSILMVITVLVEMLNS